MSIHFNSPFSIPQFVMPEIQGSITLSPSPRRYSNEQRIYISDDEKNSPSETDIPTRSESSPADISAVKIDPALFERGPNSPVTPRPMKAVNITVDACCTCHNCVGRICSKVSGLFSSCCFHFCTH